MWLFLPIGFFSITEKPSERGKGTLTIRARRAEHVDELRRRYLPSLSETQASAGTDYAFRASCSRTALSEALTKIVNDLHQGLESATRDSDLEDAYMDVWNLMRQRLGRQ
jgi:hypothetical protein